MAAIIAATANAHTAVLLFGKSASKSTARTAPQKSAASAETADHSKDVMFSIKSYFVWA